MATGTQHAHMVQAHASHLLNDFMVTYDETAVEFSQILRLTTPYLNHYNSSGTKRINF